MKTTEEFIKSAKLKQSNKFDYSKTNYTGRTNKVTIICPTHGEFEQTAKDHLNGSGCLKCARMKQKKWIDTHIYSKKSES